MAGLPGSKAIVFTGPPLSANGPSSGLIGAIAVPTWLPFTPLTSPVMPVPSPIRVYTPAESSAPLTSPPVFPATIESVSVAVKTNEPTFAST